MITEQNPICGMNTQQNNSNGSFVWFAMCAPFCKELDAKQCLDDIGIENFVPMCYKVIKNKDGRKNRELVPAVHNLIFVRTTKSVIQEKKKEIPFLQYLTKKENARNIPIIVPDVQMNQFIAVCRNSNENLIYLKPEEIDLKKGTNVRIIGGPFDGVRGVFVKIKGVRSRRVVVLIEGLTAVATTEIAPDLIEVIKE